jgi:hypothetical protein
VRYTLGAGRPSLGAKLGLADDFLPNFFPMTPPGNGTVGRGYRDLLETGFKVGENSPSAKTRGWRNFEKIKTSFWDMIIFHF